MKKKRISSILLSLALVLGMLSGMSLTAQADDSLVGTVVETYGSFTLNNEYIEYASGQTDQASGTYTLNSIDYDDNNSGWAFGLFDDNGKNVYFLVAGDSSPKPDGFKITSGDGKSAATAYKLGLYYKPTDYNLYVGGTQVTSDNLTGSGWSYVPSTKTLTLDGANIQGNNSTGGTAIYAIGDLVVNVASDCTVAGLSYNADDPPHGIQVYEGSLKITGTGTLTVQGGKNRWGSGNGIMSDLNYNRQEHSTAAGTITIDDGVKLIANSSDGAYGCGISADQGITINGGVIEANGHYDGIFSGGDIAINDGTVTATGDTGYGIKARYSYWEGQNQVFVAKNIHIADGITSIVSTGNETAIYGNVKNAIAGTGWTDTAGTTGKAAIAASADGQSLTCKKAQFPSPVAQCVYEEYVDGDWVEKTENFATIEKAIDKAIDTCGKVVLLDDVMRAGSLTVPDDANIELDLNGKTLSFTTENAIQVSNGATFTLENGTVESNSNDIFVSSDGGRIVLGAEEKKLTVNGTGSVIKANAGSSVDISQAEISTTATSGAVATASGEGAAVNVYRNCAIKSSGAKMFATDNSGSVSIMGGIFSHDPSGTGITLKCKTEGMEAVAGGVLVETSDSTYKFAAIDDPAVTVTGGTTKTYDGAGVALSASVTRATVGVFEIYDDEGKVSYGKEVTITYAYQWAKKNAASDTYTDISGATSATYTTGANVSDTGSYRCTVTTKNNPFTGTVTATINKADPTATAPTGLTATYGQTLADVTLANPEGNTDGTWAWVDAGTTSVGNVGSNTFKANFTPADTTNYNSVSNVDVTVTVNKAEPTVTAPAARTLTYNGQAQELVTAGEAEGGTMQYAVTTENTAPDSSLYTTSIPTGTNAGT